MPFWQLRTRALTWQARPLVMGVLNVTPDSFSDGGAFIDPAAAVSRAWEMAGQGADLIDIGAESTRPGAKEVTAESEWARLKPVLLMLREARFPLPISVDTWKAEVARPALAAGGEIINDVSGGQWDAGLWKVVAEARAGYILMHSQGRPETMQAAPSYRDAAREVEDYLHTRTAQAMGEGIGETCIAVDPGFGFGKTLEHNTALFHALDRMAPHGRPLLIGISRKSMLRRWAMPEDAVTDSPAPTPEALLGASITAHVLATLRAGPSIWRVHDVAASVAAAHVLGRLQPV